MDFPEASKSSQVSGAPALAGCLTRSTRSKPSVSSGNNKKIAVLTESIFPPFRQVNAPVWAVNWSGLADSAGICLPPWILLNVTATPRRQFRSVRLLWNFGGEKNAGLRPRYLRTLRASIN